MLSFTARIFWHHGSKGIGSREKMRARTTTRRGGFRIWRRTMDDLREDGIHDDFYSSLNITSDEVSRLFPRGGAVMSAGRR